MSAGAVRAELPPNAPPEERKSYILKFSTNAICDFEEETDSSFFDLIGGEGESMETALQDMSFRKLRALLWAGLQENHNRINVRKAGDLMGDLGDLEDTVQVIFDAIEKAGPDEDDLPEGMDHEGDEGNDPPGTTGGRG